MFIDKNYNDIRECKVIFSSDDEYNGFISKLMELYGVDTRIAGGDFTTQVSNMSAAMTVLDVWNTYINEYKISPTEGIPMFIFLSFLYYAKYNTIPTLIDILYSYPMAQELIPKKRFKYLRIVNIADLNKVEDFNATQREKNAFVDIVADMITNMLSEPEFKVSSFFRLMIDPTSRRGMINIEKQNTFLLATEDKVYKVILEDTGKKTISSYLSMLEKQANAMMTAHINSMKKSYEAQLKKLQDQLIEEREKSIDTVIDMFLKLRKYGWELTKNGFYYDGYVFVKYIDANVIDQNTKKTILTRFNISGLWELLGEPRAYVAHIFVPYSAYLHQAYAFSALHPNADYVGSLSNLQTDSQAFVLDEAKSRGFYSVWNLCIGDLSGKSIVEALKLLPSLFETANLTNAYHNVMTRRIAKLLYLLIYKNFYDKTVINPEFLVNEDADQDLDEPQSVEANENIVAEQVSDTLWNIGIDEDEERG